MRTNTRLTLRLRTLLPKICVPLFMTGLIVTAEERLGGSPVWPLRAGFAVVAGSMNGVFIERQGECLCVYGNPSIGSSNAAMVLVTEARRDAVWAARDLVRNGAELVAPEKEADLLTAPDRFWAEFREKRFHDYAQQSSRMPVEPMPVSRRVKGGDSIEWGGLSIRVLATPGYTRGAVSYVVELGGRKVGFPGDLIRDDGKIQDFFSLQDAIPEAKVGGYHGWAGRLGDLMKSLEALKAEKPDLLVPLRGPVITEPVEAIDRLQERIRAVYANYLSIDALRWYFKDEHILAKARRVLGAGTSVDWMEMAETQRLPQEVMAISNSRLILAADRSGFLIDCGGANIIAELRKLRSAGRLTAVEHVFVTHYHDDHTDALPLLVAEFGAKVHACGSLVDVIERPSDYRLPCLTKNPTPVTAQHQDGDTWRWKEYRFTIRDHPGQTLHHNALLVERDAGWSIFFVGDSFTPSGIDDYCLQNRDFLHEGQGYLRCLDQLERLPTDCLLVNQHVEPAFRFSKPQIARMRDTLRRRKVLLTELFPFDDPNYGLDDGWVTLHPYWVTASPGQEIKLAVRIMNHSPQERSFYASMRPPHGFTVSEIKPRRIASHEQGDLDVRVQLPGDCPAGLHVLAADVAWDGGELREWEEVVIEVVRGPKSP